MSENDDLRVMLAGVLEQNARLQDENASLRDDLEAQTEGNTAHIRQQRDQYRRERDNLLHIIDAGLTDSIRLNRYISANFFDVAADHAKEPDTSHLAHQIANIIQPIVKDVISAATGTLEKPMITPDEQFRAAMEYQYTAAAALIGSKLLQAVAVLRFSTPLICEFIKLQLYQYGKVDIEIIRALPPAWIQANLAQSLTPDRLKTGIETAFAYQSNRRALVVQAAPNAKGEREMRNYRNWLNAILDHAHKPAGIDLEYDDSNS